MYKGQIGSGLFGGADAVVDVGGGEAYAEGFALGGVGGVEGEEEGYGVGSAGDGYGDAVSGFDLSAVEGKSGHQWFIVPRCDDVCQLL